MAKTDPEDKYASLAAHVAFGGKLIAWSAVKAGQISERQCRRYASTAEFKALVAEHRRLITSETLGASTLLARKATDAALEMIENSESEGIKVAIYKAAIGHLISLDTHADLVSRIERLEQAHDQRQQSPPAPTPRRQPGAKRRPKPDRH
jgi:hypothetical protein